MCSKRCSKIALLDVDGTLIRGNLGSKLGRALILHGLSRGIYSKRSFLRIILPRAWMLLLLPFIFLSPVYFILQREATRAFYELMRESDERKLEKLAKEVYAKIMVPPESKEFVKRLKRKGYTVYLLTASPKHIVKFLAEDLGVDGFIAADPATGLVLDREGKENVVRERWGKVAVIVGNEGKEPFHLAEHAFEVRHPKDLRKIEVP